MGQDHYEQTKSGDIDGGQILLWLL